MGGDKGNYSIELCGGTHVSRTGDIGLFRITSESAVGAGIRRLEALTGTGTLALSREQDTILRASANTLKVAPEALSERIVSLLEERKHLEKELTDARRLIATGGSAIEISEDTKEVGGIQFTGRQLIGVPARDLRGLIDDLKKKLGSGVFALVTESDGKAAIAVGVSEDLTERIDAVALVRVGAAALGGTGGGGRRDMAQAGGPNVESSSKALDAVEKELVNIALELGG